MFLYVCLQIEVVHTQFKRAKLKVETKDLQLVMDLDAAQMEDVDPAVLRSLSKKLHLMTVNDLKKESLAIHELVIASGGYPEKSFEEMSSLLRKLKDCILQDSPQVDANEGERSPMKHRSPVIPDDFRCPISLELMKDPVIVSTGQVIKISSIFCNCCSIGLKAGVERCK